MVDLYDLSGYPRKLITLPPLACFDPDSLDAETEAIYQMAVQEGVETPEGVQEAFRIVFGMVARRWANGESQQQILDDIVGGAHDTAAEGRAIRCVLVPLFRAMVKRSFFVMRNALWDDRIAGGRDNSIRDRP